MPSPGRSPWHSWPSSPPASAAAFEFTWSTVLNPGNAANPSSGLGAVAYDYQISSYEVTNSQYAYLLNNSAAGKANTNNVYDAAMGSGTNGGIVQNGTPRNFTYTVNSGFANRPVGNVTWFSAARFVNWYVNGGDATASTETGSYTLASGTGTGAIATRNSGAMVWLPSADEWTKAAFYNPDSKTYSVYPTNSGTSVVAAAAIPNSGTNVANFANVNGGATVPVGSSTNTKSSYGAFDMFGNTKEWTESVGKSSSTTTVPGTAYSLGASFATQPVQREIFSSSTSQFTSGLYIASVNNGATLGFRVASVPEPSNTIAAALGFGGLFAVHMVKRRKLALARVSG